MVDRDRLSQVFSDYPEIRAVYLFGSAAEVRAGPTSDLDLAIVASPELREKKLDILAHLVRKGFDSVDLVFLEEEQDLVLAYEAVRLNCLVYAGPGFDRGATYSRIVRKYLDLEHFLRIQRDALRQRVGHGST